MKSDIVKSLTESFEQHVNSADDVEFWYARDLQKLLGYEKWSNFLQVIDKAKVSCETAGHAVSDHFADVGKMVELGSEARREISDLMLTRYACYLIAQNGDPRKEQIAFAQTYFALQTRKYELLQERIIQRERLVARQKLSASEKELSELIYVRGIDERGFGKIRSKGDTALFGGYSTADMKRKLGTPENRPLADFLPTITIKAKDFATEITNFNVKANETLIHENSIAQEHVQNNKEVRRLLLKRGIKPENLPPEEDVKKLERRVLSEDKHNLKEIKKLKPSR